MSTTIQDKAIAPGLLAAVNGAKESEKTTAQAAQDRFMMLLVTQMKNQDPLNPLDNAQMTSQLAQLSTVTGIDKLNTTLESLIGSFQSNQTLQATSMIGRGVLLPGKDLMLNAGNALLGVDLSGPADSVMVSIKDGSGRLVQTIDLGPREAGVIPLQWDGMTDVGAAAPDGKYSFSVTATQGGKNTTVDALEFGQVASVSSSSQGVKLNVPSKGAVSVTDIRQIL